MHEKRSTHARLDDVEIKCIDQLGLVVFAFLQQHSSVLEIDSEPVGVRSLC